MGAHEWRHQNPPPALPRRPVTAFLCAIGRLWSGMSGKIAPEPVSAAHLPPFTVAVHRSPRALPEYFEEHAKSLELWPPEPSPSKLERLDGYGSGQSRCLWRKRKVSSPRMVCPPLKNWMWARSGMPNWA